MNNTQIILLLQNKQMLLEEIKTLVYGSIEIRNNKYMYVHYREDGIPLTKYAGEYTEEKYNQISANTFLVKEYKKIIKQIDKTLKELKYTKKEPTDIIKSNIDFAKRNIAYSIYNQAILEGISTTFLDTESILEGGKVNNMTAEDVLKIINLKHSWEFILNENVITTQSDYNLLCEINKIILEGFYYSAGMLRNVPVGITGSYYKPDIPIESNVKEELERIINKNEDGIDKTIELLLYIMKKQMFIDGNKRTSILFANHYLISQGKGIIIIPSEDALKFKEMLVNYYDTNDDSIIKSFLKEKCYKNIKGD